MDGAVERWLSRLDTGSRYDNLWCFERWLRWLGEQGCRFSGMSPSELVEFQGGALGRDRFLVLDLVEAWVRGLSGRVKSKRKYYSTVRSFFLHNRVELPQDPDFRVVGDVPRVVGLLEVGDIRRLLDACSVMYRAVFLCMFQGGMGVGELLYWSGHGLDDLREQLRRDVRVVRVDLPGRKRARNERPYYTFIGRDAVDAVRHWLRVRQSDLPDIFVSSHDTPLNEHALGRYTTRKLKALGLIQAKKGLGVRYGKNPHELRDSFRTRWQKSGAAAEAAEFFMGHVVDEREYNKAFQDVDYARREYLKAERWLNILTEDPENVPLDTVEEIREKMEARIRELERTNERANKLNMLLEDPEVYGAFLDTLQRLKERKQSKT